MPNFTRRQCLESALAAAVPAPGGTGRIQLALIMAPGQAQTMKLARQIGVTHAITGVSGALARVRRAEYPEVIGRIKEGFEKEGIAIAGVESHPVPAEKIKLGAEGRDEEIENYIAALGALGRAGIPMVCYNFMAGLGWYRTRADVPERGGALTSEFDYKTAQQQGLTRFGEIPEEKIWANIEYFLKAVIPAAEKAGVNMALHPDDPPISPLRGIGRILTSAANYRKVLNLVPSPAHGITFCQANFKAMGEDIEALAGEWCRQKKIFFVHFRDIRGTRERFRETFHDNGPTNMGRMLRIYHEHGFRGPVRPDHAPTLEGESNASPGYALLGKILAFGYMKGLMQAQGVPFE
ncbi:MAG: mannonate dehydratase [Bryobacteraceae bacterium]